MGYLDSQSGLTSGDAPRDDLRFGDGFIQREEFGTERVGV